MEKSESIKNITDALLRFDHEVTKIGKSATNPFFKNKYAPLPEILDAIKEPLQTAGLTVKQFPEGEYGLTTMIAHPLSGEWITSTYFMRPVKDDPQAEGSRITYQRRYALGAVLGLNIDEDDDANKASEPTKDSDPRPWMTDKLYNQVLDRINKREKGDSATIEEFYEKVKASYRMKKHYSEMFEAALNSKFNDIIHNTNEPATNN